MKFFPFVAPAGQITTTFNQTSPSFFYTSMRSTHFTLAFIRAKTILLAVPKLLHGIPHEIRSITVPRAKRRKAKERTLGMLDGC
jgi:hypothetical protein